MLFSEMNLVNALAVITQVKLMLLLRTQVYNDLDRLLEYVAFSCNI